MEQTLNRLTSREAAQTLHCRPVEAIALMRAANVRATKFGTSWLWSGDEVTQLAATLGNRGGARETASQKSHL